MPELPEVEVICRGLQPHLINRTITAISCSGKALRHPVPLAAMQELLSGQQILQITRRAKYLLLETSNHTLLILHLGMTGNLGIFPATSPGRVHDHLCWRLDNGMELRFHDSRRFGGAWLLTPEQAAIRESLFFTGVGPEPFSHHCNPGYFLQQAHKRQQAIKTFLMDGHNVAGIGNIYANEILFASAIHPDRPTCTLQSEEWKTIVTLMRKILTQAIACGGSTISDFVNASGNSGYFQVNFQVYGRKNQLCFHCGTSIEKSTTNGRASYFCPYCQKK